jgi:membrane protein
MNVKALIPMMKKTYSEWSAHNAPRLGASVAFYSILSFAPLLVLIVAIVALVFGHSAAQSTIIAEARQVIGAQGASTVESLLKNAQKPSSGIFSSIIAFITLLFGASGVFTELRDALDTMWDAKRPESSGVWGMARDKLFSFGMVLSIGFLLLVSLLLSAALMFIGHAFGNVVPVPPALLEGLNLVFSLLVITGLFALMFKYIPAAHTDWKDAVIGAAGTALLFTLGKFALGIYLGKASVGSAYGAAGSLVAVVVWVYYSAQIFFFGAEFTHVYAQAHQPAQAKQPEPASQHIAEQPKAMAAVVGGNGGQYYPSDPVVPRPVPVMRPAVAVLPKRRPGQQTKPKLLMAVGLGFVLARLVLPNRRPHSG